MKRKLLMAVIALALLFVTAISFIVTKWVVYPKAICGPSMMARVVDGKTGQPVSGARVIFRVDIAQRGFSMCGPECREFYTYTTVTNADGYFVVPAWGPKLVPPGWEDDSTFSPWVQLEKEGYRLGSDWQVFSGGSSNAPILFTAYVSGVAVMSSKWDHRKILLFKEGEYPDGLFSDVIPLDKPVGYVVFAGE